MSDLDGFNELKDEFRKIIKRILKQDLSSNACTLKKYETDLIDIYNKLAHFVDSRYTHLSQEIREKFRSEILYVREKTILCFGRLNLTYTLPEDLYQKIDVTTLVDRTLSEDEFADSLDGNE